MVFLKILARISSMHLFKILFQLFLKFFSAANTFDERQPCIIHGKINYLFAKVILQYTIQIEISNNYAN